MDRKKIGNVCYDSSQITGPALGVRWFLTCPPETGPHVKLERKLRSRTPVLGLSQRYHQYLRLPFHYSVVRNSDLLV